MKRSRVFTRIFPWISASAATGALGAICLFFLACSSGSRPSFDASDAAADANTNDGAPDSDANAVAYPFVVPLSGCAPLYQATVSIGGAPFAMSLDTGSSTTAVAQSNCATCSSADVQALYSPGASATSLGTPSTATYGDGQTWSGNVYEDTFAFAGMPSITADFVAIGSQTGFFFAPECSPASIVPSGILGLGPTIGALPNTSSILDLLVNQGMPNVFAFELCPSGGTLWLGGFDSAYFTAPPQYTPFLPATKGRASYNISVSGLGLDGTPFTLPNAAYGASLVDSGGPHFFMPTTAFDALTTRVGASAAFQQIFPSGAAFFSQTTCPALTFTDDQLDSALPHVTLTLGTTSPITVTLGATESYLIRVASPNGVVNYCPGIFDSKSTSSWDIGDVVLHQFITIFDRANSQLGLAPRVACP